MANERQYSPRERFWLMVIAAVGMIAVNGGFFYGLLCSPDAMKGALTNPISAAFVGESLLLVGLFAYLFRKWGVSGLSWVWFVALSLIGSMAFAVPVVLLWKRKKYAAATARGHYLLMYDLAADYLERRPAFRATHLEYARAAVDRGELVLGGALADPRDGAVLLFQGETPATAEAFAKSDPYVLNGLVTAWRVRKWITVVGADAGTPVT